MEYRYDLHVHTSEVSLCASSPAAEMVDMYKREGYTGILITDHFLNGNTTVPREGIWEERVAMFCESYYRAKARGEEVGLDVFFGWEYSYRGTDLITLGLSPQWLHDHPEVLDWEIREYCDKAREAGGYIIHAHPFLEASWGTYIRLFPRKIDAVEVINACRDPFVNDRAAEYAAAYDLTRTAGSDSHDSGWKTMGGILSPRRLTDETDLIALLRSREHTPFSYNK